MEKHINSIINLANDKFEDEKTELIKKAFNHERKKRIIIFYSIYFAWVIAFLFSILVLSQLIEASEKTIELASDLIRILLSGGIGFLLGNKD